MAEPVKRLGLTQFLHHDLNFSQAWRERQDRLDELEFATITGGTQPGPESEGKGKADTGGGAAAEEPQKVLAEEPVKQAVDELVQYRQMRAAEGPEGGVYDATKLGRSGWPDEVARDPIAALMKLVDEVGRPRDPDLKGGMPAAPGDMLKLGKSLKTAKDALKRITGFGRGAETAVKGEVATTNLARVDATKSVKDTMHKLNFQFGVAKKTTTHAETIEGSQGALSLEEALATPDAAWDLRETRFKVQALRDLDVAVSTEADKLLKLAQNGDTTAADALLDTALIAAALGNKNRMAGTAAGQLLEARKILADAERAGASTQDLTALVERLAGEGVTSMEDIARVKAQMLAEGIDGLTFARLMEQLPKKAQRTLMRKVWEGYTTTNDAFHWLYLQSLLSSPVTHAANVLGTGVATAWHFPERYVAEWVNRVFRQDPAGVQRGETWAMMRTAGKALTDAFILLKKTIRTGQRPFQQSTVETKFDLTAAQFGWDPNTPLGKLVDTVGMVMPTRLMMGADGFFKGFNKRTELSALALREALGRHPSDAAAAAKALAKLDAKPPAEMVEAAEAAANLRTLNAELGTAGRAAMTLRNATPGAAYVMPFIQTPTNSIKWSWQRAPLLSLTSAQNIKDIAAGGAAKDLAISRILLGHAVGGVIAYHVVEGNITGGMTVGSNKNLKRDFRELGPREFTIRVGDEYYGYKRTDPVGSYIGTIATGIEIYSQLNRDDPHEFDYADFAAAAALAAGRVALDTPWLTGLANVLEAIERPDADGKKIAMGFARAIVPAGIRKSTETGWFGLTEERPEVRELETLLDAVRSGLPGFVEDVPPVLHPITGETIVRPPGWGPDILSPIFVTRLTPNPVLEEIIKHGMSFSEPSRMIFGDDLRALSVDPTRQPDGIKLSAGQYFRLKQLATTEVRDGNGRTLQEAMEAMIATEGYQRDSPGPDNGKEHRLKTVYRQFYDRARAALQNEYPSLKRQVDERRQKRLHERLPETSPNAAPVTIPGLPAILQSLGR